MIAFNDFEPRAGSPLYLQVVQYIKRGIAAGTVKEGDELPSRRVLSALLGINPGTAQKIYRILEEEGLILSLAGSGSHMTIREETVQSVRSQLAEEKAREAAHDLRQMGLSREEALALLSRLWKEGNTP